jgi:hypothetical protein
MTLPDVFSQPARLALVILGSRSGEQRARKRLDGLDLRNVGAANAHFSEFAGGREQAAVKRGHGIVVSFAGAFQAAGDVRKMFGERYDALVQFLS